MMMMFVRPFRTKDGLFYELIDSRRLGSVMIEGDRTMNWVVYPWLRSNELESMANSLLMLGCLYCVDGTQLERLFCARMDPRMSRVRVFDGLMIGLGGWERVFQAARLVCEMHK